MTRAVIFDMDGVLIDSEPLWQQAEIEVFREVGLELTPALCRRTRGLRIDEVVAYWHARHPWSSPAPEAVRRRIVEGVIAGIRREGRALPGAGEAVAQLLSRGVALGIATSSEHRIIEAVLERLGLGDAFAAVHSAQDEPRGKPHPDVYLGAAARLGVAPARCLAIEDSPAGVHSALAAGMRCVAVPEAAREGRTLEPDEREAFARAHALVPSLTALDAHAWDALLRS